MKKLLILFFLISNFCYSRIPLSDSLDRSFHVHFFKLDVFKSISSRLHFDYEYYNGKKLGTELGISIFYPNRVLSYINEGLIFNNSLLAFHYRGSGFEIKQKVYSPRKYWNPYFAVSLSYDYKHFNDEDIFIINGFRSSSYSYYENWSATQLVARALIMAGICTRLKKGIGAEVTAGLGIGYFDNYTRMNSTQNRSAQYDPSLYNKGGHENHYLPQIGLGVKLFYGFQFKR
jgi:hypothetical protein